MGGVGDAVISPVQPWSWEYDLKTARQTQADRWYYRGSHLFFFCGSLQTGLFQKAVDPMNSFLFFSFLCFEKCTSMSREQGFKTASSLSMASSFISVS